MIQNHVRNDSKLVWKAARTGIIEVWRVVVDAIEAGGGNLLEKVRNERANIGNGATALLVNLLSVNDLVFSCGQRQRFCLWKAK